MPWATVNVCDTAKQPDAIGIRASMPGTPKGARLSMRFRVQYRTATATGADVEGADSGWRALGTAQGRAGRVRLELHASRTRSDAGARCAASSSFRWRRGDSARRARPRSPPRPATAPAPGADPAGYSAATCALGS